MTNDKAGSGASAGWIATAIAVPVALVAGFVAFQILKPFERTNSTEPVKVDAAALAPEEAPLCAAVVAKLPETVRGLNRRPVVNGPEQNAAYGEPPLTVTCGGQTPAFPPQDLVYNVNGICWHADEGGKNWTTVDRRVAVKISLPEDLDGDGSAQLAGVFSAAVGQSIPPLDKIPTGCKPG